MKKALAKIALVGTIFLVAASTKIRKRSQSKVKIKQHYGVWMMRLEFALEDLTEAMEIYYNEQNYEGLNEDNDRSKLLDYISKTILLHANENRVNLLASDLKIDKNRVDLMWTIDNMPNNIATIDLSIKTCAELPKQSTALQFYYKETMHRHVLNSTNNFEVTFNV